MQHIKEILPDVLTKIKAWTVSGVQRDPKKFDEYLSQRAESGFQKLADVAPKIKLYGDCKQPQISKSKKGGVMQKTKFTKQKRNGKCSYYSIDCSISMDNHENDGEFYVIKFYGDRRPAGIEAA